MYGKISIHTEFLKKILERRGHLLETGKSGREILKLITEKQRRIVDWIHLVQCRDQRQSLVNKVIRFQLS
jgi:hypothetical protein